MTIIGYLKTSQDSCVMISDGKCVYTPIASEKDITSFDNSSKKLYKIDGKQLIIGAGGFDASIQPVLEEIRKGIKGKISISDVRKYIIDSYRKVYEEEYRFWFKNKKTKQTKEEFERDKFRCSLLCAYYTDSIHSFRYEGDTPVIIEDFDSIGTGDSIYTASFTRSIKNMLRKERKKMPKEKAVEMMLNSLTYAESSSVGGEPQIMFLEKEKFIELSSKKSMLLQRVLSLCDYEYLSSEVKNNVFGRILRDGEDYESVADDVMKKLSEKQVRDLLLTKFL